MTTAIIRVRASRGDAPGYVREGLESLRALGVLVENSDLYRRRAQPCDSYEAIAILSTQIDLHELDTALRAIENRFYDGEAVRAIVLETIRAAPESEVTGSLAAALPEMREGVSRIEGTAARVAPPALDYDLPGGAADGYDQLRPLSKFTRELFSAAAEAVTLRPGMKILDVGCGTGRFSTLFAQRGALVTGMDRSATMLEAARASAPASLSARLRYIQADAHNGFPQGGFDAVAFFMSIQYMSLSDAFFRSLRDALASNGMVAIVTLPHRHFIENDFLPRYFPSIPRIDLARFPSIPQLKRLLQEQGFDDVSLRDVIDESDVRGDDLINRVERKYVSTLHLLAKAEFERGLAAMREDLSGRERVRRNMHAVVVSARARPAPLPRRNI